MSPTAVLSHECIHRGRCPRVRVSGLKKKPELNGATGTVVAHDAAKGRYTVLVKPSGAARTQAVSLQPQNVVLPAGVCVRIEGLVKGEQGRRIAAKLLKILTDHLLCVELSLIHI